jgi:oligopeptide transport system permease protein
MSGLWSAARDRLRLNPVARTAFYLIVFVALLSLVGPLLNPNHFDTLDWAHPATPPSVLHAHWFGTDRLGRDLFVRTLDGTRISLAIGLFATAVSLLVGALYGAIAGYAGGRLDRLMMRGVEILSGLPLIFFVIFLTVLFGHHALLLFLSIAAVGWLTTARIVRGQTLSIRRQEFVEAAIAGGASSFRIIRKHVLPNVIGTVVVYATLTVPQMILYESFLSFLGLGVQEPHASLGSLIADGAAEMEAAPWILLIPGGLLAVLLLCFNLFGDGLRDALEPRES